MAFFVAPLATSERTTALRSTAKSWVSEHLSAAMEHCQDYGDGDGDEGPMPGSKGKGLAIILGGAHKG